MIPSSNKTQQSKSPTLDPSSSENSTAKRNLIEFFKSVINKTGPVCIDGAVDPRICFKIKTQLANVNLDELNPKLKSRLAPSLKTIRTITEQKGARSTVSGPRLYTAAMKALEILRQE